MSRLVPALGATLVFALVLCPASASLRLCNRTSYVLYAATGAAAADGVTVRGWTRIAPGACEIALSGDLAAQAYYLYARSSRAHAGPSRAWSGPTGLCTKDSDFSLKVAAGGARCTEPASFQLPFIRLDTHHMRSWTTTFRETPDLASMQAAERAGLKRLLADIGMGDLGSDKSVAASLLQFRSRMHVPDKAPVAALFNALETAAMRNAVPAGYNVCNDTSRPIWAALGQKKGTVFVSRGWWTVAAGSCAGTMTDALVKQTIYLRVETPDGKPLVAGPEKFCVTNIEFEIQGRGRCAQRGLVEAGFAATNTAGAAGFTAHVTDHGLQASGTSK